MPAGLFADICFLADDIGSSALQTLVEGGGTRLATLEDAPRTTKVHLITNDYHSPTSLKAQASSPEGRVVICTAEWVKASKSRNKLQDPMRYSPDPRRFFTGVCVTCTGIPLGDKEAIYGGVLALGGHYSDDLVKGTTHLVTLSMDSEKVNQVLLDPRHCIEIVLPHWFDDCLLLRRRVYSAPYLFPHPKILQADHIGMVPPPTSQDADFRYISDGSLAAEKSPPECFENIFNKKMVLLGPDLGLSSRVMTAMSSVIGKSNGKIAKTIALADIYIGKYRDSQEYFQAEKSGKVVGNWLWLFYCLSRGTYSSPRDHLLHYPVPRNGLPEFKNYKITVSNYTGEARLYLERLIIALGAEFTRSMRPDNTHLITALESGEKYLTAKEWDINCINHLWLEECYSSWSHKPVTHSHYTTFPKETNLTDVIAQTPVAQEGVEKFFLEDTDDEETDRSEAHSADEVEPIEADLDEEESQLLPELKDVRQLSSSSLPSAVTANAAIVADVHSSPTVDRKAQSKESNGVHRTPQAATITKRTNGNRDLNVATPSRINEGTPSSRGSTSRKAGQAAASRLRDAMEDANEFGIQMRRKNKLPPLPTEAIIQPPTKKSKHNPEDEAQSDDLHARIVMTGCPELSEQLHNACLKLGLEMIDDPLRATHVVSPRIARTKKFVVAIPHGPHFVNYQWLVQSVKSKQLLPESDFPQEPPAAAQWSQNLVFSDVIARAKALREAGGLFSGYNVSVTEAVCKIGGLGTYQEIVSANGGNCHFAGRSLAERNKEAVPSRSILIVEGKNDPSIPKHQKKSSKKGQQLEIFDREWLMLCAIRQEIVNEEHYQYS